MDLCCVDNKQLISTKMYNNVRIYDSLFTDIEYAAVEFSIKIPTDVAKEAGILGIDVNGKDTSIDLGKFFDKEDAFIEQWLEVSYLQAEPY